MIDLEEKWVGSLQHLLQFPQNTYFNNRIIAKEKIIKQASAPSNYKNLFQQEVERIYCSHEITEDKVNLKSSQDVPKILVIKIFCKQKNLNSKILETIDKAFGVPLLFEIHNSDKIRYCACYRRRNEKDSSKWIFSDYFTSEWINSNTERRPLPVALDLNSLYEQLLEHLIPFTKRESELFIELIDRITKANQLMNEMKKLQSRIKKEKQFNRRVELNRNLNKLSAYYSELCV